MNGAVRGTDRRTRRIAEHFGFDGSIVIRHVFVRVYAAVVVFTIFLQPLLGLSEKRGIVVVAVIRALAGLLLLANVLVGRHRLLGLIADSNRQSTRARVIS